MKAVNRWRKAGYPVRSDDEVASVLAICQSNVCGHFNAKRSKCGLCGCPVNLNPGAQFNKARMATEGCPDDPPLWTPKIVVDESADE